MAVYANRDWASVSICRIFLPAVVQLRSDPLHEKTDLLRFAEKKAIEDILQDLAKKPAVILIDVAPRRFAVGGAKFDFLAFYEEDRRFRAAWADYVKLPDKVGRYDAYVRR